MIDFTGVLLKVLVFFRQAGFANAFEITSILSEYSSFPKAKKPPLNSQPPSKLSVSLLAFFSPIQ